MKPIISPARPSFTRKSKMSLALGDAPTKMQSISPPGSLRGARSCQSGLKRVIRIGLIARGNDWPVNGPIDRKSRVVPTSPAGVLRRIAGRDLVQQLRVVRERL